MSRALSSAGIALGFAGVALRIPMNFMDDSRMVFAPWRFCGGIRGRRRHLRTWRTGPRRFHVCCHADVRRRRAALGVGLALGEGSRDTFRGSLWHSWRRHGLGSCFGVTGRLLSRTCRLLQVSRGHCFHSLLTSIRWSPCCWWWAIAHETITWRTALGTAVILVSVALMSVRRRPHLPRKGVKWGVSGSSSPDSSK